MSKDLNAISNLYNDLNFRNIFKKLCLEEILTSDEKEFILASSLLLFDFYNRDNRSKAYFRLGYYILLKYGNIYKDYKPLYEISLQLGLYPLVDYVIKKKDTQLYEIDTSNRILDVFSYTSYKKNFRSPEKYIETFEQKQSREKLIESTSNQLAFIAPTSYGKSSIIKQFIIKKNFQRIVIIVPTKSLLAQTYKDISSSIKGYKLILHEEMFNQEQNFIGVLTQERAIRLLVKNPELFFEILFIDEAHKLLDRNSRSFLLSRVMQLNYKRNNNQKIVYLSPLIEDVSSLKTKKSNIGNVFSQKIELDLKSFEVFLFDNNKSFFFDKYLNKEYNIDTNIEYFEYINKYSLSKNFIFNSRPKKVEEFALELINNIKKIKEDCNIQRIINTLSKEVHKSFYMINCIQKGVIYIHAKIPNIIKEYLEYCYKKYPSINYVVANTVILEGINLPIETIFITSNGSGNKNEKLKIKDLVNLVGRANRLNYVFSSEKKDLESLISKIHFLNHSYYQGNNDIRTSIKNLREYSFKDLIFNPLLENYNIEDIKFNGKKDTLIEIKEKHKIEDSKINDYTDFMLAVPNTALDKIKKYFIENSLYKFFSDLDSLINQIEINIKNYSFKEDDILLDILYKIFFYNTEDYICDFELERLKNKSARKFYNYFLLVTQKQHLNERINSTVKYLERKSITDDPYLYIGSSYGEIPRLTEKYNNNHFNYNVYIDLRKKPKEELVNLAIVKLKIEEDFVNYKLISLIVFLRDFKIIPEKYYFNYIYGTTDEKVISLVRFGINISIINKLKNDDKLFYLDFDIYGNLKIKDKDKFNQYLKKQPELFKFEINKYIN
ncbi:DEAD/DEAH box helicase [Apibacter muscae]|uniref:DEAD/DEAH box helicase n=1 Tax=Apibacter muscae TaxID=2509004 RepID=UPI0011ADB5DD|nr:DEAD/DEAH box helicase [Apibacter muscae]TWP28070.1 DEAD/DEAH box helicase [Apibacter muscae]